MVISRSIIKVTTIEVLNNIVKAILINPIQRIALKNELKMRFYDREVNS
jgi:hypothetical protein